MKASRLRARSGPLAGLLVGPLAGAAHAQAPREIVNTGVRAILQPLQKGACATIDPFDLASADVVDPLPGYTEKK